jgi:hypothetical protein
MSDRETHSPEYIPTPEAAAAAYEKLRNRNAVAAVKCILTKIREGVNGGRRTIRVMKSLAVDDGGWSLALETARPTIVEAGWSVTINTESPRVAVFTLAPSEVKL